MRILSMFSVLSLFFCSCDGIFSDPSLSKLQHCVTSADCADWVCVDSVCKPQPAPQGDMGPDSGIPPTDGGLPLKNGCKDPAGSFQPVSTAPMWACPGAFASGQIHKRCAPGFSLCKQQLVPDDKCRVNFPGAYPWPGFYAGDERISSTMTSFPIGVNGTCDWSGVSRAIGGCGASFSALTNLVPCRKFGQHMVCSQNNMAGNGAWDCKDLTSDAYFDMVTNTRTQDGVLCCPDGS